MNGNAPKAQPALQPQTGTFDKEDRLRTKPMFDAVFAARVWQADGLISVNVVPNDLAKPRLGLVVSKRVGNAVRRNRWKRLLREAFRQARPALGASALGGGLDLVVIPRRELPPTLTELKASLVQLTRKASQRLRRR